MTSGAVKQKSRRAKGSLSAGEVSRALIASAALGAILLSAFFVTAGSYFPPSARQKML
jgi:hypothetical protein